jgi:hypothetical protein
MNINSSIQIEDVNISQIGDELNMNDKHLNLSLFDHDIITRNQSGDLSHHQNDLSIRISKVDFESGNKIKCNFLVKINDPGKYSIKMSADYKIMRKEIYDDTSNMKYNGMINLEVKIPFEIKYE